MWSRPQLQPELNDSQASYFFLYKQLRLWHVKALSKTVSCPAGNPRRVFLRRSARAEQDRQGSAANDSHILFLLYFMAWKGIDSALIRRKCVHRAEVDSLFSPVIY